MMVTAVSTDGTKITSWRSGTGPALVLVHGTAIPREIRAVQDYRFNWNGYRAMDRPTLLLDGELSPPRLRASTAAVDAILSNSRVVVLHRQGHAALRFAPKLVAAEVLKFLRSDTE
jgi:pimeloyl-ACP methyl ester carboxylesterase